ncbi:MAG: hemerythrin family protein [Turicibacter sp.]|nr:hemerythrin family protein [Turicibacter sp.]
MDWNDSLETGNVVVDNEHKELLALVKNMLTAGMSGELTSENRKERVEIAVNFLEDYAKRHFANEEKLMDESHYPDKVTHKTLHDGFMPIFSKLKDRVVEESGSLDVALEVNKVIVDWLIYHIMGSDKVFAEYYKDWEGL